MKNQVVLSAIFLVIVTFNFACAPGSGGNSQNSAAAPGNNVPVAEGTVSGGGGNGCGGEVFEGRAKNITEFTEYQLYVRPILRKMAEQSTDPLVTYLRWVAEDKAWFFIPCALKPLSNEQLGIAVDSDQMARHIEHGIYIDSRPGVEKTYATQTLKARSTTLLHEMVMGAFLLMKKSAKEQCQALAKRDAALCADAQVMAIAEQPSTSQKNLLIVDGIDRDRITAMTAFLSSKDADLSAANMKRMRDRLGFHFPWDRASSDLDLHGLEKAFARSRQLEDRYRATGGSRYLQENPSTCSLEVYTWRGTISMEASFVLPYKPVDTEVIRNLLTKYSLRQFDSACLNTADKVHDRWMINGNYFSAPECEGDKGWKWDFDTERFSTTIRGNLDVRGVLRDGQIYDEVSVVNSAPREYPGSWGGQKILSSIVRILVTREPNPRIHAIRFEPKQLLNLHSERPSEDEAELLDIPGVTPVECVRQQAQ